MNANWHIQEYKSLRQEALERIKFLHYTLNLSIILQIVLLFFGYYLYIKGQDIVLYALLAPIFLNFLTFNYQSNQMSLEAIIKYIHNSLAPQVKKSGNENSLEWDRYFANHKRYYKFEAFFKVLPIFFPNLVPFIILFLGARLDLWKIFLLIFDFLLLIFIIENFRYKLHRVK